jgi:pyrroline-5-carboxylate reductase
MESDFYLQCPVFFRFIIGIQAVANKKIAIIGGGNLGTAIAEGLVKSGFTRPEHIMVTRRTVSALKALEEQGILVGDDNEAALRFADLIILAIKPFQVSDLLKSVRSGLDPRRHLLCSVVTGVSLQDIQGVAGEGFPLVRAMPNTAIAIQESMTCICSQNTDAEQQQYVRDLFEQLGRVAFIEEKLMDAATVLGACGTAYAMRYIRANIQGGIEIGFNAATARIRDRQGDHAQGMHHRRPE